MSLDIQPIVKFCAAEFKGFLEHLGAGVQDYINTGNFPTPLFPVESVPILLNGDANKDAATTAKPPKPRPEKRTRKPSAFNYYIKCVLITIITQCMLIESEDQLLFVIL
jgi:hypothetical protein